MKKILYIFILLFTVTCAYAQRSVSFISFFPPAHIVHNNVNLTQNANSFSVTDAHPTVEATPNTYTTKIGGLVLGAASSSTIKIDNIKVTTTNNYLINNINVDNIIRVNTSAGAIGNLTVNSAGSNTISDMSASVVAFPFTNYNGTKTVRIAGETVVTSGKTINNFTLPTPMQATEKLSWVNLRANGTEECRKYLVKHTGATPSENCNEPPPPSVNY